MMTGYKQLTEEQKKAAVQRLTALWAFTESGLGGIMHALKIPFTGLLVGGMAIVMICLIAELSKKRYNQVLKSAVIVLIVKAMVSPHTPFTAYIAVSFQALLGCGLFYLLGVNLLSIVLLSILAMLESAMQKLLTLTLFYGESLWKATDKMIGFITEQFGVSTSNGSYWLAGLYLSIYIVGGILVAWLAYRSIRNFHSWDDKEKISLGFQEFNAPSTEKKKSRQRLWSIIAFLLLLSLVLLLFAPDTKKGLWDVAKALTWTLSAIIIWYVLVSPLLTKLIRQMLKKKQGKYSEEVLEVVSFLPVLRQLTTLAWLQSKKHNGVKRWYHFVSSLIHWSLIYSEKPAKQQA